MGLRKNPIYAADFILFYTAKKMLKFKYQYFNLQCFKMYKIKKRLRSLIL
jgi:hypothetical protein